MLHKNKIRDRKGAAITGLVIALMFFVLMAGLFAFDASRVQMAQRELTATCDASALAGTAMLTSYDVSNDPGYTKLANAQQNAAAYAYNMFNMGNVLGHFLQGRTTLVTDLASLSTTTDGDAKAVIGLVDPKDSYRVVDPSPPNNANGRAIAVFAGYGYHPVFISFYGVGNVGILASSIGGLPQVDATLVFDYSGSMDDLTKVTLIKRWWNPDPPTGYTGSDPDSRNWSVRKSAIDPVVGPTLPAAYGGQVPGLISTHQHGCVQYDEVPHPTTNQSILDYVALDTVNFLQGTSLNALPPQNLYFSELGSNLTGDQLIVFKNFLRSHYNRNDFGSPPGNCPAHFASGGNYTSVVADSVAFGNPLTSHNVYPAYSGRSGVSTTTNAANIYTDLVVNVSTPGQFPPIQPLFGPDVYSGCNVTFPASEDDPTIAGNNYSFPNLATLVEASRGNRETSTNLIGNNTAANPGTGLHRGYFLRAGGINTYFSGTGTMSTRRGYQKAYQRLAMWHSQPIASALDGADQGFFQKLSALADCRFGFVGFSDSDPFGAAPNPNSMGTPHTGIRGGAQGTSAYAGKNSYYLDVNYDVLTAIGSNSQVWDGRFRDESPNAGNENRPQENNLSQGAGQSGFRIPRAQLNTSISQTESLNLVTKGRTTGNYPWSNPWRGDGLYNGRPLSGTMCAEALETARLEFQAGAYDGLSRAGSKRAIVFFTDGIPSGGVPGGSGGGGSQTEANNSWAVADDCANDGVAMFCIGLNMLGNSTLSTDQDIFLGNGSGGMSGRARNGGRYFECTDVTAVKQAFSAIARRLTQSQR